MRELKFRVWDKPRNQFLKYPCWFNHLDFNEFTAFDRYFKCNEEECTVQQYTGLKDKNGKEIYEGDIVKYKYRYYHDSTGEATREVKFSNGTFYPLPKDDLVEDDDFYSFYISDYEIIGNIFENPGLLK